MHSRMSDTHFPRIRVQGDPKQRGLQYGRQAASYIAISLNAYQKIFRYYTDLEWPQVQAFARPFIEPIAAFRPRLIEEMQAIAQGAGVDFVDILAINIRTELINRALAQGAAMECTAMLALPAATDKGHTFLGQNWDWKPQTAGSMVLLEGQDQSGLSYITLVEAGLLAKAGMNSAGIGLVTNALTSELDLGEPGIPYHVLLRAILESKDLMEARQAIESARRASSANYLVADRPGTSFNIEAAPGGDELTFTQVPKHGRYAHTNHFRCAGRMFQDVGLEKGPDSPVRLERIQTALPQGGKKLTISDFQDAFRDHYNYPFSVCSHPDTTKPIAEQYASLASIIMDLETATIWLAKGHPCQAEYYKLEYADFFGWQAMADQD